MECSWCKKEFAPTGRTRLCSPECKDASHKDVVKRYKQSDKGKAATMRWRKNPARDEIEKRTRSRPEAKKLAVERTKRYSLKHPEKAKAAKALASKNSQGSESHIRAIKKYRKTEKGRACQKNHKYRSKNGSVTNFDLKEWALKLRSLGNKCLSCGTTKDITIDHIIPLSKGGSNHISNLQPLCRSCNSKKSNSLGGLKIESTLLMWS